MDDLPSKRELNKGFANATSRGFESVAIIALFAGGGLLIDSWLGSAPVAVIVMVVLAFFGNFARMWYAYDATMTKLEADMAHVPAGGPPEAASL